MDALDVGLSVAALGAIAGGAGLALRSPARLAGALAVLAGLALLAAVLAGPGTAGRTHLVELAAMALGPLALTAYPRLRWRHPVDAVALVTIGGAGLVSATDPPLDVLSSLGLGLSCLVVAHTWWRLERSSGRERRELCWLALSVGMTSLVYIVVVFSYEETSVSAGPSLVPAVFALVPAALYVGATLPDLVDVRAVVVQTTSTVVAVTLVMATFVIGSALLQLAGADPSANLGAAAVLAGLSALVLRPTQVVLRGVVDQLLFGDRPDPLGAASAVAARIGDDPAVALHAIREALVVPYAALLVGEDEIAVSGVATTHTRRRDLGGAGTLVVGLRPGDLRFSADDEQVLRLVVPLLTETLRTRALARDVLESRGATITAVAEERRRLRRDLHDGLGPRLSGVAFTSDAARNLVRTDPAGAEELLDQLRADTVTAIEEIRQLVYAMRPPALDELGLVPALRQHARGLRNRAGSAVAVSVTAPVDLPDLPAAVEVAAYRIVTEALTNVARHSTSRSATVCLAPDEGGLRVEVEDRGGPSTTWRAGVGLSSMRERAAELGGSLDAGPGARGGRVTALLPV